MTFPPGGEFAYQARRHEAFKALRPGDVITADVGRRPEGRREYATVLELAPPAVIVRLEDGIRTHVTVHAFGALVRRPERTDR